MSLTYELAESGRGLQLDLVPFGRIGNLHQHFLVNLLIIAMLLPILSSQILIDQDFALLLNHLQVSNDCWDI